MGLYNDTLPTLSTGPQAVHTAVLCGVKVQYELVLTPCSSVTEFQPISP